MRNKGIDMFYFVAAATGFTPPALPLLYEPFGLDGVYSNGSPATPNTIGFGPQSSIRRPPAGWTSNSMNDDIYFVLGINSVGVNCDVVDSSGGTCMALIRGNGYGPGQYIQTKSFSTVGKTNITVDFNLYDDFNIDTSLYTKLTIEYSVDNSIWTPVSYTMSDDSGATQGWIPVNQITLPIGAENEATVYLRFILDDDGSFNQICIDDLTIRGT